MPIKISDKSSAHVVLYGVLTVAIIFVLCRLHYFFPAGSIFDLLSFDARFWWNYQAGLISLDVYSQDPYFQARLDSRFFQDILLQKTVIGIADQFSLDRMSVNLYASSLLYVAGLFTLYLLGFSTTRSISWSIFFTALVSQCMYIAWLRYPVLVPKMFGFVIYPVILSELIKLAYGSDKYFRFFIISCLGLVLYPASILYYYPFLLSAFLLVLLTRVEWKEIDWKPVWKISITLVAVLSVLLLIKLFGSKARPVPIEVAEYFYKNHNFSLKTLYTYMNELGVYLVMASLSFYYLRRHSSLKTVGMVLYYFYLALVLFGLVTHMLAKEIDLIRMTWLWRSSYYSYVPALLLFTLACKAFLSSKPSILATHRTSQCFVVLLACSVLLVSSVTPQFTNTVKGTYKSLTERFSKAAGSDPYDIKMQQLLNFAHSTPIDSVFLLPHRKYQGVYMNVFESESRRRNILSRMDMGLMVAGNDLTPVYHRHNIEYDSIENLKENDEYESRLWKLAMDLGATHIILPAKHADRIKSVPVHRDSYWLVYDLN